MVRHRAAVISQALAAIALVAFLLHHDGVRLPFLSKGDWHVQVAFRDASGLSSSLRAPVLVAGVQEGRVESVSYQHGLALAKLRLNRSARGVLRSDAVATIEPRSALEDLTVNLTPGSPSAPALQPGGRIAPGSAVATVPLDRVVDVLDADTRSQVAILLDQLASGLRGQAGPLRSAVAQLGPLLDSAGQVTGELNHRRKLLSELVDSVNTIASTAGRHQAALAEALKAGRTTLDVTAAHDSALSSTVNQLPATLASLNSAMTRARAVAAPLQPALTRLELAARTLPGALASVRAAAPQFTEVANEMSALEHDGSTSIADLGKIAPLLAPTASALRQPVSTLAPIVQAVNANRDGIGLLGERFSGVLSTNDANGPILRGLGSFEPFNPADVGEPNASPTQRAVLATKAVKALTNECLHDNPLACLARYLVPGLPGSVRSR